MEPQRVPSEVVLWGSTFLEGLDPLVQQGSLYGHFAGKLAAVGCTTRVRVDGQLDRIHSTQRGFGWVLTSTDVVAMPSPPFFLTDKLELTCYSSGDVSIQPSWELQEYLGESERQREHFLERDHFVCGAGWIGVIRDCRLKGSLDCTIYVFGEPEAAPALTNIWVADEEETLPIGTFL